MALATLIALGNDLSQVHKESIISSLHNLQRPNSSFQAVGGMGSECDMLFLYCACAISYMLDDWTGVDTDKAVSYIKSCVSFNGAIALVLPGQEGHGGLTFCGVASLVWMDKVDDIGSSFQKDLVHWCVSRQVGGIQGRPNKAEDTCCSYWIDGTLRLLNCQQELLDEDKLCWYVMTCQTPMGGFGKVVGAFLDVLHSFYSMVWFSLSFHHDLKAFDCTLGICQERAAFLEGKSNMQCNDVTDHR
jgi:geranylgeranyl transferase type-1 subunit beta